MTLHRFITIADPTIEVVTFPTPEGGLEVHLIRNVRSDTPTRMLVPPPPEGQRIVTRRYGSGEVEVLYEPKE